MEAAEAAAKIAGIQSCVDNITPAYVAAFCEGATPQQEQDIKAKLLEYAQAITTAVEG